VLKSDSLWVLFSPFPPAPFFLCPRFKQSQGQAYERASGGVAVNSGMMGLGGVHKGHFHMEWSVMVVRGGRRQSIFQQALHMSQRSIFFRQSDFVTPGTGYPRRGGWQGRRGGMVRARERLRVGVSKWD